MHPAIKVLIGALMIVVGAYASQRYLEALTMIVKGSIGPLLILIGAFIVWLESDEWKMERDERKEEKTTGLQEQLRSAQTTRDSKESSEPTQRGIQRDYSEVLEGTVDEAKERIRNMENPNYDALIAAEQRDKGRKTLLEWIERQKD